MDSNAEQGELPTQTHDSGTMTDETDEFPAWSDGQMSPIFDLSSEDNMEKENGVELETDEFQSNMDTMAEQGEETNQTHNDSGSITVETDFPPWSDGQTSSTIDLSSEENKEKEYGVELKTDEFKLNMDKMDEQGEVTNQTHNDSGSITVETDFPPWRDGQTSSTIDLSSEENKEKEYGVELKTDEFKLNMDKMDEQGEVKNQTHNDSGSITVKTDFPTRSDGQTSSTIHLSSEDNKEKENGVEIKTDEFKLNMDKMNELGEVTNQTHNVSGSITVKRDFPIRSDGQTSSTIHPSSKDNKEKENGVKLKTDDFKLNMDKMDELSEVTNQTHSVSGSITVETDFPTRSDGQTSSIIHPSSEDNKEKESGVKLKTDDFKLNMDKLDELSEVTNQTHNVSGSITVKTDIPTRSDEQTSSTIDLSSEHKKEKKSDVKLKTDDFKLNMDKMNELGEVTNQTHNVSGSITVKTDIPTRSDEQTSSTIDLSSEHKKEKKSDVKLKTDDFKLNMDKMNELGEVTNQTHNVSGLITVKTDFPTRSNGQTSSIINLSSKDNKEKESGVKQSNATSSSNRNTEDSNTGKNEPIEIIKQLTDSITRLSFQLSRMEDDQEFIKQQITANNQRMEQEKSDRIDGLDNEPTEVQNENKAKSSVCDFVKEFAETSTIHGLPRLSSKGWGRTFWSLLLLGALVISTLQVSELFKQYFTYPVNTDISFHFEHPRFPQIAVCMSNPFKSSAVMAHQVSSGYSDVRQLQTDIKDLPEEERIKLGYEASEILIAHFSPDTDETEPTLFHHRSYGNCYAYTPPDGTNRVYFKFNLNSDENLINNESVAVHVFLSQVGLYPFDTQHEIEIKPYTEVISTFQLEEVSKLNGKHGNCQDDEEIFKERTGFTYTQSLCLQECKMKQSQGRCDCVVGDLPPGFKSPELSNSRKCGTLNDFGCSLQVSDVDCQCKPMCRQSVYTLRTEEDDMQDHGLFDYIHGQFFNSLCSNCNDWAQKNYATFAMEAFGQHYKEYKQTPLYPLVRFLSDIGGTLGLYIGSSVLTFFELIHMLSGLTLFLLKRRSTE